MNILRFITAGSVDDGKSTLTGRLLYETNHIKTDILKTLKSVDNGGVPNLAFLTDGLRAERQQGITIDVAYKYFATDRRKYISVDAPGHVEFTKNMVTGASGVDAIIVLIDARNGITDQTRTHTLVASFMRIKHVLVAVNKMDVTGYDEQVFARIKDEYLAMSGNLDLGNLQFIPVSALIGDNISRPSENMPWHRGQTLLQFLETCETSPEAQDGSGHTRFTVQYTDPAQKGYAGKLHSGRMRIGDPVRIYPGEFSSVVTGMIRGYEQIKEAEAGQNIHISLAHAPDIKRGTLITGVAHLPCFNCNAEIHVCWLDADKPLLPGKNYLLRMNSMEIYGTVTQIRHKINAFTYETYEDGQPLKVNQFAVADMQTETELAYDPFTLLRETGRGIIIDPETNNTSGAFTIIT